MGVICAKIALMAEQKNQIRVRFAPSPTGFLHVGVARTALFNFLFAQKNNGVFVLRIEDTDKQRSKQEYTDDILAGLEWLGISPDETYHQSQRTAVYEQYLAQLIESGHAYEAEENEAGTGKVIRFRNPNTNITFTDTVRGEISFDTSELGDFVIAKDKNTPLYQLTVVVDDHEMGITHIIRGEDLISSTPRQLLIGRAIGATEPLYAHLPLLLGSDRSKLSKRHGAVSLSTYEDAGYLPDAFINFLALLGGNPGDDTEIFSRTELTHAFSLDHIQKGGAIFNTEKLDWINKEHIHKTLSNEEIVAQVKKRLEQNTTDAISTDYAYRLTFPTILERIHKWADVDALWEAGELEYFFRIPEYGADILIWKKGTSESAKTHLERVQTLLTDADFSTSDSIKEAVWDYAEKEGKGDVLWPMRVALSGREKSPDPFTLSYVLGKEETVARLRAAIDKLT